MISETKKHLPNRKNSKKIAGVNTDIKIGQVKFKKMTTKSPREFDD